MSSFLLLGAGTDASAGGAATTTWNPADKTADLTLSNGNLTATATDSLTSGIRSVASHSTGKFYYEAVVSGVLDGVVGWANSTWPEGTDYLGQDANSISVSSNGQVTYSAASQGTVSGFVLGDTISVAADFGANLYWFRTNAGNWNNNVSANPATGTGGISVSITGARFAAAKTGTNGTVVTANFGATTYAQSVPSGFGNL